MPEMCLAALCLCSVQLSYLLHQSRVHKTGNKTTKLTKVFCASIYDNLMSHLKEGNMRLQHVQLIAIVYKWRLEPSLGGNNPEDCTMLVTPRVTLG